MVWTYQQSDLEALAREAADNHSLPYSLVAAVCEQESSWNPWATRYEPEFYIRYIQPMLGANLSNLTEAHHRSTSWGLMQIMGEVARELGYKGLLPQLCEPDIGLDWGCLKLSRLMVKHNGNKSAALLEWNGGGNANYPVEVLARVDKYSDPNPMGVDESTQV